MIDEITHHDNLLLVFPYKTVQLMITKELLVMNSLCVYSPSYVIISFEYC